MSALEKKPLRGAHALPSPADWEDWEGRLLAGEEPSAAAAVRGLTCSNFRRADEARQRELLALRREALGFVADRLVDDDVVERDEDGVPVRFKPGASDSMKQFFVRRWQPAYTSAQVEVSGEIGMGMELAESLDRWTALVANATVRGTARREEERVGRVAVSEGEGAPGVDLVRVAGEAGSS